MTSIFTSEFFKLNRDSLKKNLQSSIPIVVTANGMIQRGADSSYPFYQDANFWYLTGIDDPDITLVMEDDREFLIVPIREGTRVTFDGQINQEDLSEISGVKDIVNEVTGWKRLDSIVQNYGKLATLAPAPAFIEQYGMYANPARERLMDRIKQHVKQVELEDIRPVLANMRMIKQKPELEAIQGAIDITIKTLKDVLASPKDTYDYEYQMEADITRGFRFLGADGHSFDPIVAGGQRACTLHNTANSAPINKNELVVLDVGASFRGYAADITRVYASSAPSTRQKEVFEAVKAAQAYAISLLGPGVRLKAYEAKVVKFIGEQLKDLGLVNNLKESSVREYFPHATSHFMGLNVHDVGNYQQPLKPGTVLTVEPGIYIKGEGIGVRIEDDVLITNNGVKVLSSDLPSKL